MVGRDKMHMCKKRTEILSDISRNICGSEMYICMDVATQIGTHKGYLKTGAMLYFLIIIMYKILSLKIKGQIIQNFI